MEHTSRLEAISFRRDSLKVPLYPLKLPRLYVDFVTRDDTRITVR